MKMDNDFINNGISLKALDSIVNNSDIMFQEIIKDEDTIICKIDKADRIDIEEITNKNIKDLAKEIIITYSSDSTIKSGLDSLTSLSKLNDGPALVGYKLVEKYLKN